MALTSGTKLGPYEIESLLGAGGMGEVYLRPRHRLQRTVAIKILPAHLSSNPDLHTRFEQEAKSISRLQHPNICVVHDIGSQDGVDFMVMEYVAGQTLDKLIPPGGLPTDSGDQVRGADCRCAVARSRRGHRAPRSETGEHHGGRQRPGQGARLRTGQTGRASFAASATGNDGATVATIDDNAGDDRRHAGLYVAGAGGRETHRRPQRCLLVRFGALRDADWQQGF